MVTLAGPLGANMPLTEVTATAFTLFDGVQTIRSTGGGLGHFEFATNARGEITTWYVTAELRPFGDIGTSYEVHVVARDVAQRRAFNAFALDNPGEWRKGIATPDAGSTLSLMTLTLMALGLVARRFQRADRARAGRSSLLAFHHQARYIG